MRTIIALFVLMVSVGLSAQGFVPKNLKVLPADVDIRAMMGSFKEGLGVACSYCHVQGNYASDENPKKNLARQMIRIVMDVNSKLPEGVSRVACYTCHRGQIKPVSAP